MKIKIGTRKSKLALAQTEMFIEKLVEKIPNVQPQIVHISTTGDKVLNKPLAALGGKGVFIAELEQALLNGEIDVAVHSAKDLPLGLADGLGITAVLERGDYRDVLVTRNNDCIINSDSFLVGTGSMRRARLLKKLYPNVQIKNIRGNVDTRLNKLLKGEYDGIILAAAGLKRLNLFTSPRYTVTPFDCDSFLPAPCQGIIAVESRKQGEIAQLLKEVNHLKTMYEFEAERQIPLLLNADCAMPVGAFAQVQGNTISLYATADCNKILKGSANVEDRLALAERLVKKL